MNRLLTAVTLSVLLTTSARAGGTVDWPPPPPPPGANPAAIATPRLEWFVRFQKHLDDAKAMSAIDVIFDGDTLTDGWMTAGKQAWDAHFAKLNAFDFGTYEDHSQNLLWRLENGQVDNLHPKLVVLMIGSYGLANDPTSAAEGIKAVVDAYRKHCPDAVILLQGILPRGKADDPARTTIKAVNQILSGYADGKNVIFIDFGDKFVLPDGSIDPNLIADLLHPTGNGYETWANAIQPFIDKYGPTPSPQK